MEIFFVVSSVLVLVIVCVVVFFSTFSLVLVFLFNVFSVVVIGSFIIFVLGMVMFRLFFIRFGEIQVFICLIGFFSFVVVIVVVSVSEIGLVYFSVGFIFF